MAAEADSTRQDGAAAAADSTLDITTETCPMTFVRTRLALDRLQPGQVLLVRLRGAEPIGNVPRAAAEQGHEVLSTTQAEDGVVLLRLRRGPVRRAGCSRLR
jgi:tRNA 2-thiouridine synthesizing protein A